MSNNNEMCYSSKTQFFRELNTVFKPFMKNKVKIIFSTVFNILYIYLKIRCNEYCTNFSRTKRSLNKIRGVKSSSQSRESSLPKAPAAGSNSLRPPCGLLLASGATLLSPPPSWWTSILGSTRTSYAHSPRAPNLLSHVESLCLFSLFRQTLPLYGSSRFVLACVWIRCSSAVVCWIHYFVGCYGYLDYVSKRWLLGFWSVWTWGCARVRVCKGDWKSFGEWRLVRKEWNLWIAWFCSENKFGALSLMLVGIQWSFKGQFCLMAWSSKLGCF